MGGRICLVIVLMATTLYGEVKSGFAFLKAGIGARPVSLGSAYTALANDATAIYWNPSGLASLREKELSLMHSEWLLDSSLDFMGFAYPSKRGVWGAGVTYLSQPSQEGRDETGQRTQDFKAQDLALSLALSRNFNTYNQIGASLKFIQSRIGADKGEGLALDLGALRHLRGAPVSLGISLLNLGPGIRFIKEEARLPLTLAGGLAYHLSSLSLATDVKYRVYDRKTVWALGTEYSLLPSVALRTGYSLPEARESLTGLGAGFGLKILNTRFDYALTPFGELGRTHRVNLAVRFW